MGNLGGRRPGAGRPKGQKQLDKLAAREELRKIVIANLTPLLAAQIEHAKGIKHMILRGKDGQFIRATDEKQIDAALAIGESAYYLFTKDPSVQAFTDLMNRALDKPVEPVEVAHSGGIELTWQGKPSGS
jgi:hypothetical protein